MVHRPQAIPKYTNLGHFPRWNVLTQLLPRVFIEKPSWDCPADDSRGPVRKVPEEDGTRTKAGPSIALKYAPLRMTGHFMECPFGTGYQVWGLGGNSFRRKNLENWRNT
jgi:hypothetical protein